MTIQPDELRSRLTGHIAFPVTPFGQDLQLDLDGLRASVRILLEHPPAAIVAAGGTGELYSLTPAEHLEVLRVIVEECRGHVPVIAGVGFNACIGAQLAAQAARAGADGVLAFPPYYPNPDEDGLFEYYRALASSTSLGLLIYSRLVPSGRGARRTFDELADVDRVEGRAGGYPPPPDIDVVDRRPAAMDWRSGDDMVPAYYAAGIRAYTSSVSNLAPRLAHALHEYAVACDRKALDPIMSTLVVPLYALRARRRGYEVSVMKALMDLLGRAGGPPRPPLPAVGPDDMAVLRELAPMFQRWHATDR